MVAPLLKAVAAKAGKKVAYSSAEVKKIQEVRKSLKVSKDLLDKKISSGNVKDMASAQNFKKSLEDNIKASYAAEKGENRGLYQYNLSRVEESAKVAKDILKSDTLDSSQRTDKLFTREINQASIGGVSTLTKEETKIFYSATQEIWEGKPIEERNEKIKEYFGVETIKDAWDIVYQDENVKEALRKAKQAQKPIDSENDEGVYNGEGEKPEEIGSPEYSKELRLTNDTQRKYQKNE